MDHSELMNNTDDLLANMTDIPYFGYYWIGFRQAYLPIHGWLSISVCVFGIVANILNIIVLTRKEMISPTNSILTGLAVADCLVMTSYLPFSIHNFIRNGLPDEEKYSRGWAIFTLFHAHFTIVCHTISIWLTVILAIWRYLAVSFPTDSKAWCNMSKAKYAILFTYIACPCLFCLPVYLTFTIDKQLLKTGAADEVYVYKVNLSAISKAKDGLLFKLNFWIFSVLTKLVPCIALTYLSLALIRVLYRANQRKQRLKQHGIDYNSVVGSANQSLVVSNPQSCDRTTRMLLAILLIFLITEFPSGILALFSGMDESFLFYVYNNFGEVMDMLALTNSAINFILYCTMSRQFRKTFAKLFCTTIIITTEAAPATTTNDIHRRIRQSATGAFENTCQTTCV